MSTDTKIGNAADKLIEAFRAAGLNVPAGSAAETAAKAKIKEALSELFKNPDLIGAAVEWAGRAARLAGLKKIAEALESR